MSNDEISSGASSRPPGSYGEHELSYLEEGSGSASHPIPGIPESSQIDPQSHEKGVKASNEGSPPPNSATTSGSTSTPSSFGGLSTGGDLKNPDHSRGSLSSHFSHHAHTRPNEGWPVPVSEGITPQPCRASETNPSGSGGNLDSTFSSESPEAKYNPSAYSSAIKLLVSNNVAGSIIGRAGQTISELQTQASARIKLSQTGDYFPGTQDRVCLVQGEVENVKLAVRLLLERLYMLQEQQHSQQMAWQPKPDDSEAVTPDFDFVVRLVVPSSSCGMIIGKAGANIKHMEETSGASSVRLSPKDSSDPNNPTAAIVAATGERVLTITGPNMESCLACVCIVLEGMSVNHEICRYTNMTTSYSRLVLPGSYTPVQHGRPLLVVPSPIGDWDVSGPYGQFIGKRSTSQPDLAQVAIDQQRTVARIPPDSTEPSMQQYGPAFTDSMQTYSTEVPPMMPSPARTPQPTTSAAASPMYLFPPPGTNQIDHASMQNSSSAPDLLALQFQDSMRISNPPSTSPPVDYSQFAPQLPQPTPPGFTAQVLVPDSLIGSILGRGGKTLNELQMHSNTRIRISQRGEYVPGTKNRIVTIRGPTAHSVSLAQYLMSQRMVLPPTATYSQQTTTFLHPSQFQPQPQQQGQGIHHHQSHSIQSASLQQPTTSIPPAPPTQQQQHQVLHDAAFLSGDSHAADVTAGSSLTLSPTGNTDQQNLPPQSP